MVDLILAGYGGVGKAIVEIFRDDRDLLKAQYGFNPRIVAISEIDGCLVNREGIDLDQLIKQGTLSNLSGWQPKKTLLELIPTIKADILIECTWTNPETGEPALGHVIAALNHGMHVVSSNKGPFYLKYHELHALAAEKNLMIGIESTVGSAVPCIATKRTLAGSKITRIQAILNGTSNYILSRMTSEGLSFDLALKEAQAMGYAEADPSLDIGGYDAAGKLVILANALLGWNKTIKDVKIEGITKITAEVISLAYKDNYLIKHVGIAEDGELWTGLKLIPMDSPFAVNGSLNAIELTTQNAGPILLVGRGAGRKEAASGIIADIINIVTVKRLN
jgi:homoserine dehydrogenase